MGGVLEQKAGLEYLLFAERGSLLLLLLQGTPKLSFKRGAFTKEKEERPIKVASRNEASYLKKVLHFFPWLL